MSKRPSTLERGTAALLRAAGVDYVSQYPVPGTGYVADFYLPRTNAIVEVDGERRIAPRAEIGERGHEDMLALGFKVVRLSSREVWRDEIAALEETALA